MTKQDLYAQSGVDIDAGEQAVQMMKAAVQSTYGNEVLSDQRFFGSLFDAGAIKNLTSPILAASTDGVGTKTMVAAAMNQWDTIGQDLVNHCVNDILVQGARPLFFLDYVASSQISPEQIAVIVQGMALACREAGCALIGGETAEMPGVYQPNELDLVGTVIGVVDRQDLIDGAKIKVGDVLLALPSTGLHTNGYSLARKVLGDFDWQSPYPELGMSIGEALLAVHRCYLNQIETLKHDGIDIHGLAHITGGGIVGNLSRIVPDNLCALISNNTWDIPPIFRLIQNVGDIADSDMYRAFNMGVGMIAVIAPDQIEDAQKVLDIESFVIGEIQHGNDQQVVITGVNV